jgi:6-pyruvoyltetrahydropterin/6-carboxytetrahydropterin synthase
MYELSKEFWFDAAHTLNREIETESSRRIHGHSYRAEVVVRGQPNPSNGMIIDLGLFERALQEARDGLDHRLLDEINDLGPATMENLSAWIWRKLKPLCPSLYRVTVRRDSDRGACSYYGSDDSNYAWGESERVTQSTMMGADVTVQ